MKLIGLSICIYIICFIILNFSSNKNIEKIIRKIEKREKINSFITTIFLGIILTSVIAIQTNRIMERQVSVTNRETAPMFRIEKYQKNNFSGYKVINEKGMASYVTLNIFDRYSFRYNGESYEINFAFFNQETNGNMFINEENPELLFLIEKTRSDYDSDEISKNIEKYVKEKLDESISVYKDRYIELSFYDYKNQRFNFRFIDDDKIRLINTGNENHIITRNVTQYISDMSIIEKQVEDAVDFVINHDYNSPR